MICKLYSLPSAIHIAANDSAPLIYLNAEVHFCCCFYITLSVYFSFNVYQICLICNDPFEQYWDEEAEDWHLRDAIKVDGKVSLLFLFSLILFCFVVHVEWMNFFSSKFHLSRSEYVWFIDIF